MKNEQCLYQLNIFTKTQCDTDTDIDSLIMKTTARSSGVLLTFRVEKLRTETKIYIDVPNDPLKLLGTLPDFSQDWEAHNLHNSKMAATEMTRTITVEPKAPETRSLYLIPSI